MKVSTLIKPVFRLLDDVRVLAFVAVVLCASYFAYEDYQKEVLNNAREVSHLTDFMLETCPVEPYRKNDFRQCAEKNGIWFNVGDVQSRLDGNFWTTVDVYQELTRNVHYERQFKRAKLGL